MTPSATNDSEAAKAPTLEKLQEALVKLQKDIASLKALEDAKPATQGDLAKAVAAKKGPGSASGRTGVSAKNFAPAGGEPAKLTLNVQAEVDFHSGDAAGGRYGRSGGPTGDRGGTGGGPGGDRGGTGGGPGGDRGATGGGS